MWAWSVLEMIRPGLEWWKSPLPNPSISIKHTGTLSTTNWHLPRTSPTTEQDLLELTPQKDVPFIIGDWNAKVGSQETPAVTGKFGLAMRNEAGQRLIEFCQENALVLANTLFQQHKRRLYTWTSPDGQHLNQIDYILCSQRWRSSIQSTKRRPGLTVAQIMNSLLPNSDSNWRK